MSERIKRRDFIKCAGYGLLALGLAPKEIRPAILPDELVVVKGELISSARKAIEFLGGIKRFVKQGDKVLIKPNMSFAKEVESGANTHPELVAEVARWCLEAGAKEVLVIDNPLYPAKLCLWRSGIREAMDRVKGASFQYLTEERFYQEVEIPGGKDLKKVQTLKPALEADIIINVPKAKTHGSTTVTLGLKNLMGLVYEPRAFHSIHNLHQAIAELSLLLKPGLTIIDASNVMVDGGPGGPGTLERRDLVVAGINPVEVDSVMVSLSNWYGRKVKPDEVKHLKIADELGLGKVELGSIRYSMIEG